MSADRGDWIQTVSGAPFWPASPAAVDIRLDEIAHALSRKCRFNGHTRDWYSVAQHAVMVSEIIECFVTPNLAPLAAFWALHHDDSEAYLPDVPRPLKASLEFEGVPFKEIENRILARVAEVLLIPWPWPAEISSAIKQADAVALATEKRDLMNSAQITWQPLPAPWLEKIIVKERDDARQAFLIRHEILFTRFEAMRRSDAA